jgi:N-methylhydantoinase A
MSRPDPEPSTSAPRERAAALVAVDTGGTFTDLLVWHEGRLEVLKVPSTPHDPAEAVLDGLARVLDDGTPFDLLHGSTVATNTLLERKGARVVLVTNRGIEDVLAIGRQNRPQLYALVGRRDPPLIPRERRLGVSGRLAANGAELEPVDSAELMGLADRVRALEPAALALTLLHSYADTAHEEAVAAALETLDLPLSVSSRLLPEYREFERTSTTVVNAYVAPVMDRYLGRLDREAGARRLTVMGSGGGALDVARARREPVHTVLSGPAGGVVGALAWARRAGKREIVTFDMGGTSTDVSLCPGRHLHTREFEIGGYPVAVPVLDIHTVGAGGGSLAWLDPGGALRVGPESAGATPGPVCYGRGGEQVTVTDAHVWLGRMPVDAFLGGATRLDRDAVADPLARLARALNASLEATAEGVLDVADTAMERALRVISVERGHDPAGLALVAFGGAGGLHAAALVARLGAERALIPPDPGLLSAWGMLTAPVTVEASRTVLAPSSDDHTDTVVADALEELCAGAAEALRNEGAAMEEIVIEAAVDARYRGQSFEIRVPAEGWVEAFHAAHALRYGYRRDDAVVEAVTLRATARAPGADVPGVELAAATGAPPTASAHVVLGGRTLAGRRVWRRDLRAGHVLAGPTLVLDYSGTTWIPPGWRVEVDASGILHLLPDA